MKTLRRRRPRIFYWVTAHDTNGGVRLWWVPAHERWVPQTEALALRDGPRPLAGWIVTFAMTLSRAKWVAMRSPTGATIQRMIGVSNPTRKQWNIPARKA